MSALLWRLIILCALIIAYLFLASRVVGTAHAHDWYSKQRDPLSNYGCCGGSDCAPVDPKWVSEVPQGYRLVMTTEEAKTVNPGATKPIDAVIPWSRVQSPPHAHAGDGQFFACIYMHDRNLPYRGVLCFFATPTM